jgi:hypothetical protein
MHLGRVVIAAMAAGGTNGERSCREDARNLQQRKERNIREQTWYESRRKGQKEGSGFRRAAEAFFNSPPSE